MLENLAAFVEFGFRHIIPDGPDHMLFVVALFLNARGWASLVIQVTTFTVAHTITLGLAATGLVEAPANIVEPVIALSIAVLAVEAIFFRKANVWRLPVIFAFGLFHGLGFGSLMKAYLESADLWVGLAGITIGVEAGHLSVLAVTAAVALAVQSALKSVGQGEIYRRAFLVPVAIIIALVGTYWTVQRIGLLPA
ncbi:MAG TPA: HupE/UreJ family protein [Hyphomonadaceae bacterium]|nr:HupE/UreJ family protein [Hyphomonadaceae bacterium]